jgi:TRAP-type C4-dicarboxylate transport system permease small subunit
MNGANAVFDALALLSGILAAAALIFMAASVLGQIFGRAAGLSVVGADEMATYAMIVMLFAGLAHTHHHDAHLRVELIVERFRGRTLIALRAVALIVTIAFVSAFMWYTFRLSMTSLGRNAIASGLLPVPLWLPQSTLWLGAGLYWMMLVRSLVDLVVLGHQPASEEAKEYLEEF